MASLAALASHAVDLGACLLAPPRCAGCDARVSRLAAFCPPCAAAVERDAPGPPGELSAFVYGGPVARAIARLKYEGRPDLARPLGDLLLGAALPHAAALASAVVVPVPLHPSRLAERGYNQAALLGARLSRGLGAALLARALGRGRDTPRQATLGRQARGPNVAGAFVVRQPERVRGRLALVVDDVRTTGATLAACAEALARAGAGPVWTAVLARAG